MKKNDPLLCSIYKDDSSIPYHLTMSTLFLVINSQVSFLIIQSAFKQPDPIFLKSPLQMYPQVDEVPVNLFSTSLTWLLTFSSKVSTLVRFNCIYSILLNKINNTS